MIAFLLFACSSVDHQKEAQAALDAGDAEKALQHADEGLKAGGDKAASWRLEQLKLEAMAKKGQGKEIAGALERLGGVYGPQVTPALYLSLADKVRASGGGTVIDVLDAGKKKWPTDTKFDDAIAAASQGGDPAEVERLKALGYIQ